MTVTSKWVALHEVSDYLAKGWREVKLEGGLRDAVLMVSPEEPASEGGKVECPNCHHEDTGHAWKVNGELRYSCKGWNKPAQPEPVAAEMPEAVRNAIHRMRWIADHNCGPYFQEWGKPVREAADALESFWLTHAAQPAKARMTEELERVLDAAEIAEEQARVAWVIQTPRSRTLKADIAAVRAHAAEAGKVKDIQPLLKLAKDRYDILIRSGAHEVSTATPWRLAIDAAEGKEAPCTTNTPT